MRSTMIVLLGSLAASAALPACGSEVNTTDAGGGGAGAAAGAGGGQQTTASGGGGSSASTSTDQGGSGGETTTTGETTTGETTSSSTTGTLTVPSGEPVLAFHVLRLGDKLPNGQTSSTAWQGYGANLDGKVSSSNSVDLCKPAAGANKNSIYPDGTDGIDNSFGRNVLPILQALSSELSAEVNAAIDEGAFSMLVRIEGIGAGQTGTFLSNAYTAGFPAGSVPAWMGSDEWQVRSDSLDAAGQPKASYPTSQVQLDGSGQRVWTSEGAGEITLVLALAGTEMRIPIKVARMSAILSDDNTTATGGQLGGVIDTEAFLTELAILAGSFDASLCPPSSTFESIAQQIRQTQDILLDGTQDPAATCSGISIGLGFDAEGAVLGSVYDAPILPDPCAP